MSITTRRICLSLAYLAGTFGAFGLYLQNEVQGACFPNIMLLVFSFVCSYMVGWHCGKLMFHPGR